MEIIDSNSIELYNRYIETFSEVDKRPKNVQCQVIGYKKGPNFYEVSLSVKEQMEALAAWMYEQKVLRKEYKNREVV